MYNSLIEKLEENAKKFPNKIFVKDTKTSISFKEISEKAKYLAQFFIKKRISNLPIAVIAHQNVQTIINFFAILYSGNFYVPIAPDTPMERLSLMLKNTFYDVEKNNRFVLDFDENFITYTTNDNFLIKDSINIEKELGNTFDNNLIKQAEQTYNLISPIYLIYTSGSTGNPKGVLKNHISILSFVNAFITTFNINENDIIGNQTPFYFDASAKDIYLALTLGATLQIIPKEHFSFPLSLVKFMNENKITFISWVPSALSIVSQFKIFSVDKPQYLKNVFFVGEVMPIKHLNYWLENLPNVNYVNLYGSSETAGIICYYKILHTMDQDNKLPIGKPLSNSKIILLNNDNQLCKIGEEGEICASGLMLSNGYYNDKEKTDSVFVQNPLNKNYREIIYRTGDIAYYDKNGDLIYACRKDFQIKHMGQRIELMDIEFSVNTLNFVRECCCCYDDIKKRIILFYSLDKTMDNSEVEIKTRLKDKLPTYMIPNRYVYLESLPKNKNGKLDRTKLKTMI